MTKSPITCSMNISELAGQFTYQPLTHDTCAVTGYTLPAPVCLTLPEYAPDGRLVVAVGDRAFANCTSLRSLTLPASVASIGVRAFAFCTSLLDIRLCNGSRLSHIGDRAFMGCERLTVLRLDRKSVV